MNKKEKELNVLIKKVDKWARLSPRKKIVLEGEKPV